MSASDISRTSYVSTYSSPTIERRNLLPIRVSLYLDMTVYGKLFWKLFPDALYDVLTCFLSYLIVSASPSSEECPLFDLRSRTLYISTRDASLPFFCKIRHPSLLSVLFVPLSAGTHFYVPVFLFFTCTYLSPVSVAPGTSGSFRDLCPGSPDQKKA